MHTVLAAHLAVTIKKVILDELKARGEAGTLTPAVIDEVAEQCQQTNDQALKPLSWYEERVPGITPLVVKSINATVKSVMSELEVQTAEQLLAAI